MPSRVPVGHVQEAHSIFHVKETKQTSEMMMWSFTVMLADRPHLTGRNFNLKFNLDHGQLLISFLYSIVR